MAEGAGNAAFPTLVAFCVFRSSLPVMLRSFRVKHASQPSDVLADTRKSSTPSLDGAIRLLASRCLFQRRSPGLRICMAAPSSMIEKPCFW